MDLDAAYPALDDLARRARRRIPRFAWEYLDSGTGDDGAVRRSRAALDRIVLTPRILAAVEPDLSVRMMGRDYPLPVGAAPVGMTGLIWPHGERVVAGVCADLGLPYGLSTAAAAAPEDLADAIGTQGWFQLYPPGDAGIRNDLLARAEAAGFHTLILTADVPAASRRERLRRARLTNPMRMHPRVVAQAAVRPTWALATLRAGIPRLRALEKYADVGISRPGTEHAGYLLRTAPDWALLEELRAVWPGTLVVKGVLDPADAVRALDLADAVWVSAHGGRQFSAAPAPADALPAIRAAVGPEATLIADGAVASGTDVLRLLATGADFVMVGRALHHGLAAFGARGVAHAVHILRAGMETDMRQLGLSRLAELPGALVRSH
ncbi:alpha-hydroxy-acid oxidizing protein [Rhodobacteraceae bacterium CCMM004]|nr:alpha-hydroxy-acid oxidizing protein [Rhodobacteraceae bacterium CCMM004]